MLLVTNNCLSELKAHSKGGKSCLVLESQSTTWISEALHLTGESTIAIYQSD